MKLKIATGVIAGALFIGSFAQAASVNVELWDVLAGPSTCCSPNPSVADQDAARVLDTNDTVLNNLASPLSAAYLPSVTAIMANNSADATFTMDSQLLVHGFFTDGVNGLGTGHDKSINDFLGFDIGALGQNSVLGTILRITGFVEVTSHDPLRIRSDDGYSIQIGDAALIANDGLQAPKTTNHSYTGTAGVQAFTLIWFDNQVSKAALGVEGLDFVAPVPLPAGLPLMLAGLGTFGYLARKRKAT